MPDKCDPEDFDDTKNYDEACVKFQDALEKEVILSQPLIGVFSDFSSLDTLYATDSVYYGKVQFLKQSYKGFRGARGDGNCFYRSFGFSYLEHVINFPAVELRRAYAAAHKAEKLLMAFGYPDCTTSDFYENFIFLLDRIASGCTVDELWHTFNDLGSSNYIVVFLRLAVSAQLQEREEFFSNFMEGGTSVKDFCLREVEPMGRASDHIHISAITAAFPISVDVVYMDRSLNDDSSINKHSFETTFVPLDSVLEQGNDETNVSDHSDDVNAPAGLITLLYRPGHYDILYP